MKRAKPYYELGGHTAVTPAQRDFCQRRVGGLTEWCETSSRPLVDLLANAYFLGLSDATETFSSRDERLSRRFEETCAGKEELDTINTSLQTPGGEGHE